jgi:hypothetical protein
MLHTHLSYGAGTIEQLVADVTSRLSLTPLHEMKKIIRVFKKEQTLTNFLV